MGDDWGNAFFDDLKRLKDSNDMLLPEVRKDLRDFEKVAAISVDVLVSVEGMLSLSVGRYIHGAECWQVNGWSGSPTVIEWWPLPEKGTGNLVS